MLQPDTGGSTSRQKSDVALALTRAYVRTTNTYLRDEKWQKDTGFMNKLSERLKTPVDVLRAVPGQVYNWDIPVGAATRLEELYIETKTLKAKAPDARVHVRGPLVRRDGRGPAAPLRGARQTQLWVTSGQT